MNPFFLLFFADMTEKFQYHITIIRELPFKIADTLKTLFINFIIHFTVKTLTGNLIHPAGI